MNRLVEEQPDPKENDSIPVWPQVMLELAKAAHRAGRDDSLLLKDMQDRHAAGVAKYNCPLQTRNGRDALVDAYQESLDLVVYLRQAMLEGDHDLFRRYDTAVDLARAIRARIFARDGR